MNGYAAAARIRSVSPRFAGGAQRPGELVVPIQAGEPVPSIVTAADDPLPAASSNATLGERWSAARERWSQLTFYLTDPNSWR